MGGCVELNLVKVKKVTGVYLNLKGYAEVFWTEQTGAGKTLRRACYTGRQDYMDITIYLAGSKHGEPFEIPAGQHILPFSRELPHTLVTSIEGKWGFVRYTAKLVLERPWKFDNAYKVPFSVLRHVNLNRNIRAICHPNQIENTKAYCCWPCSSNPMSVTVEIPISGYVPGQIVAIKYDVRNQSNKTVNLFKAKLIRIDTFISMYPRPKEKCFRTVVAKVKNDGIGPRQNVTFKQYLKIPPLPPTSLSCSIITVTYRITIEVDLRGWSKFPPINFPLTIGTTPLVNAAVPGYYYSSDTSAVIAQPTPSGPLLPHQSSEDLPPPSYREATNNGARVNIPTEEGAEICTVDWKKFNPKYLTYHKDDENELLRTAGSSPRPIDGPKPNN
ncbi:arrestin domain-containing protein 3-like isoform X7 [Uranotaenia lowii]|uniref:arrestin domain-containing protein 3-like isoform X7 n=1 Tax=Uranotaenia lowii TaxID=190385 RepID=UPI0024790389|nr:arrestin domain-containing protein 3-like isoform X7 [Uranotaenia lowii]